VAALRRRPFASCNLTLADRILNATGLNALLPGVFEARASCADAAVSLLGVPYELWSGALFIALGVLMLIALRRA
jgi:disulfide bond formation protein DsbB